MNASPHPVTGRPDALDSLAEWTLDRAVRGLGRAPALRSRLLAALERRLRRRSEEQPTATLRHPPAVQADRLAMKLALLNVLDRVIAERRLSDAALRGFVRRLILDVFIRRGGPKAGFVARHGCNPPDFLVLSPGKACNLRCVGCYAAAGPVHDRLSFRTLERVVHEAHDAWGMRFFVISGGEPLAYRDEGKGVLDLAERHPDCYFMMYTNGTLIGDEVARRMGQLGNLIPGLSVEGLEQATDARRGRGVFRTLIGAMERLRRERVLFGLSLTATRQNADEILSDEVVGFYFGEMGALYAWVFHYMPIGRAFSLDLMLTPEQRHRLWQRVWHLVRERRLFLADFWNSGTATNGCVAGGRSGGYLHVNWDGWVSPCVFIPYAPANIGAIHARGGTLEDAWAEAFFADIRTWQRAYGYRENGESCPARCGNWLTPCLIRDHHDVFRDLVAKHRPTPTDADARAALLDPAYREGLLEFDRQLAALTDPVWERDYLACRPTSGH